LLGSFRGYNADPAQFEVIADTKDPLKGEKVVLTKKTI
jgi:hypothetical protein